MRVIASVNHKGGVGKTTLAITLAHWLSLRGHNTVIIDLDGQGSAAQFLGLEPGPGLFPFLVPEELSPYLYATGRKNLWIIPNNKEDTAALDTRINHASIQPLDLDDAIRELLPQFDYAILDSAPSVGALHTAPLLACDYYLVPVKLDRASISGARSVVDSTASLASSKTIQQKFLGFVPNFWDRRTKDAEQWLSYLYNLDQSLVFPSIPVDAKLPEAMGQGKTILEYAPHARSIRGVKMFGSQVGGFNNLFKALMKAIGE